MGGLARRFDDEPGEVEARGQHARGDAAFQQRGDPRLELREDFMKCPSSVAGRGVYRRFAVGVKEPAVFAERETVGHARDIVGRRARGAPTRAARAAHSGGIASGVVDV